MVESGPLLGQDPPCIATMGPCDITLPPAVMSRAVTMALPRLGVGQMAGDWAMPVGWDTCNTELGTEGQDRLRAPQRGLPPQFWSESTLQKGCVIKTDKDRRIQACGSKLLS